MFFFSFSFLSLPLPGYERGRKKNKNKKSDIFKICHFEKSTLTLLWNVALGTNVIKLFAHIFFLQHNKLVPLTMASFSLISVEQPWLQDRSDPIILEYKCVPWVKHSSLSLKKVWQKIFTTLATGRHHLVPSFPRIDGRIQHSLPHHQGLHLKPATWKPLPLCPGTNLIKPFLVWCSGDSPQSLSPG